MFFQSCFSYKTKNIDLNKYEGGFINALIQTKILAGRNDFIFLLEKEN